MKRSQAYIPTSRYVVPEGPSVNHDLLTAAGYVNQLMAGSYTLLPLGLRVYQKIEEIIRQELAKTGAEELLMPLLHPRELWDQTGRWDKAKDVMFQLKGAADRDFALSFTHEEVLLAVTRNHLQSYKDLPIKLYHFSTKFRQELRPKSGLLRGREFIMKDLYSLHHSREDFDRYFEEVAQAYLRIFERLEIPAKRVEAAGGVFTDNNTLEFQVESEAGEDTVYECENGDWIANDEILSGTKPTVCPQCGGAIKSFRSIEVGNNFAFGTSYSEKMGVHFTDASGKRLPAWFGSYGIGMTRAIATITEKHHDEKGLKWPTTVAPFDVYLIDLSLDDKELGRVADLYSQIQKAGINVLWDDRPLSAGQRFAEADLLGIPLRLVASKKTLEQDKVELKGREESAGRLIPLSDIAQEITSKTAKS